MPLSKQQPQSPGNSEQVAVVAFRRGPDGLEICLIRRKGSKKWGIPKGFIDGDDTAERAALTEALEEAGLTGQLVGDPIGTYRYEKWNGPLTVAVYVMEVLEVDDEWEEMEFRERQWRSLKEAAVLLSRHPVRTLWDRAKERVARLDDRNR